MESCWMNWTMEHYGKSEELRQEIGGATRLGHYKKLRTGSTIRSGVVSFIKLRFLDKWVLEVDKACLVGPAMVALRCQVVTCKPVTNLTIARASVQIKMLTLRESHCIDTHWIWKRWFSMNYVFRIYYKQHESETA